MKNQTIRLDSNLFSILQNKSFDNFTITELRDALCKTVEDEFMENIRMNAYRQIQQLVNAELLLKNGNKYSKSISYQKTSQFYDTRFLIKQTDALTSANPPLDQQNILDKLKERLEVSEFALFSSIGETEEYLLLAKIYPELKTQLNPCYKQSQKQTSKIKGKIKVLQSLIGNKLQSSASIQEFA